MVSAMQMPSCSREHDVGSRIASEDPVDGTKAGRRTPVQAIA